MSFHCAQTFYIDPSGVQSAAEVGITCIDLYFKTKPDPTRNKSGIQYPGVTVQLVPTLNGVPILQGGAMPTTRMSWNSIVTSTDATLKTRFRFSNPAQCDTGAEYAFVISFDGDEDFELWTSTKGYWLVGTTTPSPGPSTAKYDGSYYSYISAVPYAAGDPGVTTNASGLVTSIARSQSNIANTDYVVTSWQSSSLEDLKFDVSVARYSFGADFNLTAHATNASPISAQITGSSEFITTDGVTGEVIIPLPAQRYEYMLYDRYASAPSQVLAGEACFQNTVFYPGGTATPATVAVTNGSTTVTGTGVNFSLIMNPGGADFEYIIITSVNHRGANADSVAVRRVMSVVSNTVITIDQPAPFTNTVANFFRSPVARVDQFERARIFGNTADMMIMKSSSANASLRFVNNCIEYVTVTANGTGYSNSDYITITGFESVASKVLGGYAATANIVTNASGNVVAVYLANLGCGFTNASAISVAVTNSSAQPATGTGLTLSCNVGSTIRTEFLGLDGTGGYFRQCKFINLEIGDIMPGVIVNNPPGTFYSVDHRLPYYSVDDTATSFGKAYYCDSDIDTDQYAITPFTVHRTWELSKRRTLPSWSNEWYIPYANGAACGAKGGSTSGNSLPGTSNSSVIQIRTISNNDFVALKVAPSVSTLTITRYIANWDATNEHTNYGNAWSKGIESRVNFANNSSAEDIKVFATVYRPANTEVLCYAKLYNSADSDGFTNKDWTLLRVDPNMGTLTYSSPHDTNDMREITWCLSPYPNTAYTLAGQVTAASGNVTLTGSGTSWQTNATANVVAGSMVKLYNSLFPNTYMISVVSSVTNATSLVLTDPVSNTGLVGAGMKLDVITYNHQAFNNGLNENVVRYYNSNNAPFDGFDTFALKIVMLSADGRVFPALDDIRGVGVSA